MSLFGGGTALLLCCFFDLNRNAMIDVSILSGVTGQLYRHNAHGVYGRRDGGC